MKFSKYLVLLFCLSTQLIGFVSGKDTVATSAEEICPLLPGMEVPDVELTTIEGGQFVLKAEAASQPTVIIFYRGGW